MVGSGSQLVGCNSFAKPLSQLKTVAKLIKSSNKNSFMVGGHHPWETVKGSQHQEGWEALV